MILRKSNTYRTKADLSECRESLAKAVPAFWNSNDLQQKEVVPAKAQVECGWDNWTTCPSINPMHQTTFSNRSNDVKHWLWTDRQHLAQSQHGPRLHVSRVSLLWENPTMPAQVEAKEQEQLSTKWDTLKTKQAASFSYMCRILKIQLWRGPCTLLSFHIRVDSDDNNVLLPPSCIQHTSLLLSEKFPTWSNQSATSQQKNTAAKTCHGESPAYGLKQNKYQPCEQLQGTLTSPLPQTQTRPCEASTILDILKKRSFVGSVFNP